MTLNSTCCGCHIISDYGTSTITGDGSQATPYSADQVDPLFERPVVRGIHEFAQNIPNNTPTPIEFSGVIFDSHKMYTHSVPTQFTVQVEGLYLIGYTFDWDVASSAAFYKAIDIRLNGTTVLDTQTQIYADLDEKHFSGNYTWFFSVGDYIEIVARHTSGGNENIIGTSQYIGLDTTRRYGAFMMYLGKKV